MGKASASKKIKRVQAAGVSRSPGQRRNLGFPALVIGIVLVGTLATFFARDYRRGEKAEAPVAAKDHWHAAFAIWTCDSFQENVTGSDNLDGFYIGADKLIHIRPYSKNVAGKNATFGVLARNSDIKLGDGQFTDPSGETFKNGDECTAKDGKKAKGRVALYVWPPQATDKTKPEIITKDLDKVRFEGNGQAFVLAFAPEGAEIKLPPTLENLKNPDDSGQGVQQPGGEPDNGAQPGVTVEPGGTTPEGSAPEGSAPETTAVTDTTAKAGD